MSETNSHNGNSAVTNIRINIVTLGLVALILISFVIAAIRVNQQANQINDIVEAQSKIVFGFEQQATTGEITVFEVTCIKLVDRSAYKCATERVAQGR